MKQLLKRTAGWMLLASCSGAAEKKTSGALPLLKDTAATAALQGPNPYAPVDLSAMDIAYFPVDYPIAKMAKPGAAQPLARVVYSRPHKQGRTIFGTLLTYGEPWRLGANEATEIELFRDATVQGKKVAKGRYILYAIPQAATWTVVFNGNVYSWGLKPDTAQDKYRFDIPVEKAAAPVEFFTMVFQETPKGADLLMAWDDVAARLPFSF